MQRRAIALLLLSTAVFAGSSAGQPSEWQPIGPDGASILALAARPGMPEVIYAGGFAALFGSTDGGATWTRSMSGLPVSDIGALYVASDGTVYAGTFGAGVYRSTDGGASFAAANTGLESASLFALTLDADAGLWAGTSDSGIFYSTDGGGSWDPRSNGLTDNEVQDILSVGSDTLYAATRGGVFLSTDSGASWSPRNQGLTNLKTTSLARRPDGSLLYVGTTTTSTQESGVYTSTDGGESWTLTATGLLNNRVADLLIDAADPDILFAATQTNQVAAGIYRSTNAGATWTQVPGNPTARDARVLTQAGAAFFSGSVGETTVRGGVFRSTDGLAFDRSDRGIVVMRGRTIASYPGAGNELFVGAVGGFREPGGVYRSPDGGMTWNEQSAGLLSSSVLALSLATPTLRYAGTAAGVWRFGASGGEFWQVTALNSGTVRDLAQTGAVGDSLRIWAATGAGVYYSPSGGLTFELRNSGLTSLDVKTVAVDPATPGVVYAGTGAGGIFRSTDDGAEWAPFSVDLTSLDVRDIVSDGEGRVFAATAGGVFELVGMSWVARNAGLTDLDVRSLAAYRSERYAATASGVFRQAGETSEAWLPLNDGLPTLDVHAVYADTAGGRLRLFAVTDGRGFFFADETVPVRLSRVEVFPRAGRVELRFSTAFEQDHLGFHIERRLAGEAEFSLETPEPLTGGPEYRFVDEDPSLVPGTRADYRILALSFNGATEVAARLTVVIPVGEHGAPAAAAPSLAVLPNPFATGATLALGGVRGWSTIRIVDISGRQVRTLEASGDGLIAWDGRSDAGVEVAAGVYLFHLAGAGGEVSARAIKIR